MSKEVLFSVNPIGYPSLKKACLDQGLNYHKAYRCLVMRGELVYEEEGKRLEFFERVKDKRGGGFKVNENDQ